MSATIASSTDSLSQGRLPPTAAFYLQSSIAFTFLMGSSAPTPLYAIYRAQWGFSAPTLTLVFAVYAVAVLIALLVAGRLSDHVGRRPVLLAATLAQAATMALFATATDVSDLLLARTLQGLSTGAAIAAVGAGLLDIDKARGAVANSVAPMLGTALGGLVAALMIQYLPSPTHLVYEVLGAIFILQAVGVWFVAETATKRPGALRSLRPRFALPSAAQVPLALAAPAIVAVWALGGFYASLGPTLVRSLSGSNAVVLGGAALFALMGSGALSVLVLQHRQPLMLARFGAATLVTGVALVMAGLHVPSLVLFALGTVIAGVGFGAAFQGALRTIVGRISPQERAGVLSVVFVISYLALGVPAVVAGYGLARQGDIVVTALEFGATVIALALLSLLGTAPIGAPPYALRSARSRQSSAPSANKGETE